MTARQANSVFAVAAATALTLGIGLPAGASTGNNSPSPSTQESPSADSDRTPKEEQTETSDKAEDKPADEYYPELAKKLFKTGEGQYKVPNPTAGGKSAGKVPAGLDDYYS